MLDFLVKHTKKKILNENNCFKVWNEFARIQREDLARKHGREYIALSAEPVFSSDSFTSISQDRLIELLEIDFLHLPEIGC